MIRMPGRELYPLASFTSRVVCRQRGAVGLDSRTLQGTRYQRDGRPTLSCPIFLRSTRSTLGTCCSSLMTATSCSGR